MSVRLQRWGQPMRASRFGLLLPPFALGLALSGCIPAGGDYRLDQESPATVADNPQIKAEPASVAEPPSWSPATVERNAQLVEQGSYTVAAGDSLYRIESKTGAGFQQLADINDLSPPYAIRIGQRLTIPGGLYHRVSAGETGIAIARAYGVSWADTASLNKLQHPYILRDGQRLLLPDVAIARPSDAPMTLEQRAAAFKLDIDDIVTGGVPATPQSGPAQGSLASQITRPGSFAGAFAWPASGAVVGRFGAAGAGKVNDGINIAAAEGSPVKASADGVVVYAGNEIGVFGGLILVDHGDGWVTAYGHLGELDVTRGARVKAGQLLGTVSETGYVSEPQLHFEIRKDRKPINPLGKLPAR